MLPRIRTFFARHPILRDAALWAIPAILFGAVLRLCMLHYQPYAYWGSDSNSYYSFAHKLLSQGYLSLGEKRRFLYPILMVPVTLLPGATLKGLAWMQHALGLLTLLPLAYVVRKTLVGWKLWIIPATVIYAGFPMILWYEHELLGETVFFAMLVWAFGGWVAWAKEERLERSRRLFWWFFVPLALFILTKPSGRFAWPGIMCGLLLVAAWRKLDWRRWAAIGALIVVTLMVGSKKQGAWLLYVASFPLTQLDSPKHAEYKAQVRDMVQPLRENIGTYYIWDEGPFAFLEKPSRHPDRPLWAALDRDEKARAKLYMDLAVEGIKARPDLFALLAFERFVMSINPSEFKEDRFTAEYFHERLEHHYDEWREAAARGKKVPFHMLYGWREKDPMPPYAEFKARLAPDPNAWTGRAVQGWVAAFDGVSDLAVLPQEKDEYRREFWKARPTPLGWWMIAGVALAFLPRYRNTLGVWLLVSIGYALGAFAASQANPRYGAPVWPAMVVTLFVPADCLVRLVWAKLSRRAAA